MTGKITQERYIPFSEDFDWENAIHIDPPVKNSFTKGSDVISWITSSVYTLSKDGKKQKICFELPEQLIWGIQGNFPYGSSDEDKTIDKIDGFQIGYPLTSKDTVNEPTEDEKKVKKIFDAIWNATLKVLKRECKKQEEQEHEDDKSVEELVPAVAYNAYSAVLSKIEKDKKRGNKKTKEQIKKMWSSVVKPLYVMQKTKDEKTKQKHEDPEKPQIAYIKLMTSKKGRDIKCDTRIFTQDDKKGKGWKKVNYSKFLSIGEKRVSGDVHPVVYIKDIYWGAHGTNTHGIHANLRVGEMEFKPRQADNDLMKTRILGAGAEDEESSESDDSDQDFDHTFDEKSTKELMKNEQDPLEGKRTKKAEKSKKKEEIDSDFEEEEEETKGKKKKSVKK